MESGSSFDTHTAGDVGVSYGPAPLELAAFQYLAKGHFSKADGCWHRIQTHFCSWRTESLTATPQSYLNAAGGVKFELNAYTVFKSLTVSKTYKTAQIKPVKMYALLPIQKLVLLSFSEVVTDKSLKEKKKGTRLPGKGVLSVQLP